MNVEQAATIVTDIAAKMREQQELQVEAINAKTAAGSWERRDAMALLEASGEPEVVEALELAAELLSERALV